MSSFFVTGASGFLGQRVCAALSSDGHKVIACSRQILELAAYKTQLVANYSEVIGIPDSICIHLAESNLVSDIDSKEVEKQLQTVEALINQPFRKILYASSSAIYGDSSKSLHAETELIEVNLLATDYQRAKFAAENKLLKDTRPNTLLRFSNIYGRGMSTESVVMTIVSQLQSERECVNLRSLSPVRDFLHVDDAVAAIVAASLQEQFGIYNIASGKAVSIKELFEVLRMLYGNSNIKLQSSMLDLNSSAILLDVRKAQKKLGWSAKIELAHGLKELIERK